MSGDQRLSGYDVRGRSDHSGKAHSGESFLFKSRGGTGKLKCFMCHSKGHMKRDCPMKKSSGFVKNGKHDQDFDSSNDEGGSYHMTHMRDLLYDFKGFNGGSAQLGDNKTCTIKGTGKVKIQLHNVSSFILEDVSNNGATVSQRWLGDKQPEEKINIDCLVKEQEKVHLGIKVRADITVIRVPGQEGLKGNGRKKIRSKEAKLRNLLKYKAWLTWRSSVRGSSIE
nr:zinc finger, CCHC-type [Tanacetum cinerariifolium]